MGIQIVRYTEREIQRKRKRKRDPEREICETV